MKHIWGFLGIAAAVLLAGYFIWFAANSIDLDLLWSLLTPLVLSALLAAALLYAAIIPLTGWAWARLLAGQGETWPASWLTAVLAVTQLAKYVPGNIAQHAGRAGLALRKGMTAKALAVTVVQETILTIAASVIVGMTMLAASKPGLAQLPESSHAALVWLVPILLLAVLILASVHLSPARLAESPRWILRMLGQVGGLPGARIALLALAAYALNYVLIGIGLWLLASAAGLSAMLDLPLVTAAFALSWLLGFLAPGAPAGLGVREGILVVLLSGTASDGHLLAFVLLARLATMLGDAINFILGTLWFAFTRRVVQ